MKATIVPAQVTTVEDRIMGGLSFSQLMLLLVPIFMSAGMYAMIPPFMDGNVYKYIGMAIVALLCSILAIRIKGRILASWLVTILRYNLRPKYYLFNKNTTALREQYADHMLAAEEKTDRTRPRERAEVPQLELHEVAKVMAKLENPAANLRFETTRKGGLYVRLTEIEE